MNIDSLTAALVEKEYPNVITRFCEKKILENYSIMNYIVRFRGHGLPLKKCTFNRKLLLDKTLRSVKSNKNNSFFFFELD